MGIGLNGSRRAQRRPAREASAVDEAFADARAAKRALYASRSDAQRDAYRAAAVRAYLRVVEHGDRGERCAEALFRCAELLRVGGNLSDARHFFGRVETLDSPLFGPRASFELGHMARRAGDVEGALVHYEKVVRDVRGAPYLRDHAEYWRARMLLQAGLLRAAFPALQVLRERVLYEPLATRVRAAIRQLSNDDDACEARCVPVKVVR